MEDFSACRISAIREARKANLIQSSRGTVEERQQRLRELQEELVKSTGALDELLRQQAESRSRLTAGSAAVGLRRFSAEAGAVERHNAFLGSLTDKIRCPTIHHRVEAALGHHLQLVLTEQRKARLRSGGPQRKQRGRASIAALPSLKPALRWPEEMASGA